MTKTDSDRWDIPTNKASLLAGLEGRVIAGAIRYSWWPPAEVMSQFMVPPAHVFAFTGGSLVLQLDSGPAVGFNSDASLVSVVLGITAAPVQAAPDFTPIDVRDPVYSQPAKARFVGRTIRSVDILEQDPKDGRYVPRPRQVAVVLHCGRGEDDDLVLSHGLHNGSDDFSPLTWDEVAPSIRPTIHPMSWR